jgi:hypothetical protein
VLLSLNLKHCLWVTSRWYGTVLITVNFKTFVRLFQSVISLHCPWRSTIWRGNWTVRSHGSVALTMQWNVYRSIYRQPVAIKQCRIQFVRMGSAQVLQTRIIISMYTVLCTVYIYKECV